MGNNSVPKFIFRLSRFPVYRRSVLGRFYCIIDLWCTETQIQNCRVTLSFLLIFIILFTIFVNIINFQTAPIILIHVLFVEGCRSLSFSIRRLLHSSLSSSFLGWDIFISALPLPALHGIRRGFKSTMRTEVKVKTSSGIVQALCDCAMGCTIKE